MEGQLEEGQRKFTTIFSSFLDSAATDGGKLQTQRCFQSVRSSHSVKRDVGADMKISQSF